MVSYSSGSLAATVFSLVSSTIAASTGSSFSSGLCPMGYYCISSEAF